jgi:HSP20 family protein
MRDEISRMFGSFDIDRAKWPVMLGSREGHELIAPQFDVHESDRAITIEAELPGVNERDVEVTFANGILTIKGQKKAEREEKKKNYYVSERSFGSFERSVRLPSSVDDGNIAATFDKGVLTVTAAKRADATPPERKIAINTSS